MSETSPEENSILNSVSDGVTVNSQGVFVYVNETLAKMVGYTVSELTGMSAFDIVAPDFVELIKERDQRRQQGEDVVSVYEIELQRRDESRFPVEISITRIDYMGKRSSLTITRDITERKKAKDEFENLFNLSPDMQCICTPEGEFIRVNLACEKILGYTADEIVKLGWAKLVHPDDIDSTTIEVDEQLEGGSVSNFINRFRCKDGSYKTLEWQASPVINGKVYATARDITERKKREDELRYHAMLLQNLSDGVISTSMDSIIMGWNKASENLYGYTETEAIGKSVVELLRNEYVGVSRSAVLEAFSLYGFWEGEVIQTRKNGEKICVDAKVSVFHNDDGEPIGIVAVNRDITEQKLAEDSLRESETLFRGFMESATDGYIIYDEDMRFVEVNDSWLLQTGLTREDVIGKLALEVYPDLKDAGRYDAYLKVLETGESVEFSAVESVSLYGKENIIDVSAFKVGEVLGIVTRDVSERVIYRRRLQALHSHAVSLAGTEEISEIIAITCECLIETLGFKRGSLGFVEGDQLVFNNHWGYEYNDLLTMPLDGLGFTVKAVNTGESILVNNANQSDLYVNQLSEYSALSVLDVPVILNGEAFAVINLESKQNNAFSVDDQRLVETLASHIASAYAKIKYNERLSALHSFAFELDIANSVEEVVETTFRIMKQMLGFQFSSFQLLENEGLVSVGTSDRSNLGHVMPLTGKGITVRAAREAHTMLVGDVSVDPDFLSWSTDSRSEVAVPIISEDRVLGVLNIESLELDAFSEDDARLMEVLAQNVASAMFRLHVAEDRMELEMKVIAEQVRVEQEQELSELKTQIMNTATHELRTPVTSILGFLELILSDPDREIPADIRKDLEVVVRNANRLATFTNDLLDVQRLTSGKFVIKLEPVDIINTLNETLGELSLLFAEKHQVVDFVSPKELYVPVDELRISQIFINLLRNANKYTPTEGNITVKIESSETYVQISVMDSGVGLSEEDIGKLFSPFPEIRPMLGVTSTGLGLAICKGIVDLHNGEIWVESDGHGKGSTFHVKLPLKQ